MKSFVFLLAAFAVLTVGAPFVSGVLPAFSTPAARVKIVAVKRADPGEACKRLGNDVCFSLKTLAEKPETFYK